MDAQQRSFAVPLADRTAIVTGAGRGIGAAIAAALDASGARVALVARSMGELESTAAGLANEPVVITADLGTPDGPAAAVRAGREAFEGRIDVLVNNAGVALRKDSEDLTADELDEVWNVNVRSALLTTVAVLPSMLAQGSGSIVSISSISGLRGAPRRAIYAASKAALDGMTRSLAMEYGPRGIRANCVAPGVVETEMWRANLEKPGVADAVLSVIPTRRLSTPEEVADAVVFLASDASSAITGEVLCADGGIHATVNLWPTV
ncbi:MAG: SDR family oxidoreductase [Actinomycetota bacterium]|nr:SDR family oxidoreductase [Actinomycetota bacterium]